MNSFFIYHAVLLFNRIVQISADLFPELGNVSGAFSQKCFTAFGSLIFVITRFDLILAPRLQMRKRRSQEQSPFKVLSFFSDAMLYRLFFVSNLIKVLHFSI